MPRTKPDGTPWSPGYIEKAQQIDLGRLVHGMFQQGISERLTRYQVSLRSQVAQDLAELKALQAEDAVELEAVAAAEVSSERETEGETGSG